MARNEILIKKLAWPELSQYRDFIAKAKYKSYSQFSEIPAQALDDLFLDEIEGIRNSDPVILVAENKEEAVALLTIHKLEWDTAHFGIPMGRIRHILGGVNPDLDYLAKKALIDSAAVEFKKTGIRHISIRLSADDVNAIYALEAANFYLADTILEYYFDFRNSQVPEIKNTCHLRLYQKSDFQELERSSKNIFKGYIDRFQRDPNLDKTKSYQLYEKWIINSCQGLADEVVLASIDRKLAGFLTMEIYHKLNNILPLSFGGAVLVGVVPEFRNKKVHTSMLNFAQNYFKDKVDLFRYATQVNNLYAQKALVQLGFFLKYAFHTFHCYL